MSAAGLLGNKKVDADFVPNNRISTLGWAKIEPLTLGPYVQKSGSL